MFGEMQVRALPWAEVVEWREGSMPYGSYCLGALRAHSTSGPKRALRQSSVGRNVEAITPSPSKTSTFGRAMIGLLNCSPVFSLDLKIKSAGALHGVLPLVLGRAPRSAYAETSAAVSPERTQLAEARDSSACRTGVVGQLKPSCMRI